MGTNHALKWVIHPFVRHDYSVSCHRNYGFPNRVGCPTMRFFIHPDHDVAHDSISVFAPNSDWSLQLPSKRSEMGPLGSGFFSDSRQACR